MIAGDSLTGPSTPRRRAFFLLLGAVVMAAAAWVLDGAAGVPVAAGAALFGWLACWIMRPAPPAVLASPPPAPKPTTGSAAPPFDREALSALRHDLRGILSPALLMSDRLIAHPDPAIQRAGDVILRTVERATARLEPPSMAAAPDIAP